MKLIRALQNPDLFDHPVEKLEVIETHISWVLLTGPYAYKIKKPVNFGFLDFSTLQKRKHYCEEELRLNRRLAPKLYIDVIAIHGTDQQPKLQNQGPVIEYAVKMKQFSQDAQLDRLLAQGNLLPQHIDKIAHTVANFHLATATVPDDEPYGNIEHVGVPVMENFDQIRHCISDKEVNTLCANIQHWCENQLDVLRETINERKQQGFVRECHGDMHLRNIALLDDDVVIFDCIEFNNNFYFIDVMSEIAFLIMDLEDRQQYASAYQFLNLYLELTGDYAGLKILNFYKVYRAMVRAKVDALRISQEQPRTNEYKETYQDLLQYLQLAQSYTHTSQPLLLINHGLSGSGKTFTTRKLSEALPAIVLRSDIERKRLFTKNIQLHHKTKIDAGIYTPKLSDETYQHLVALAKTILLAGYTVIIDAANLKQSQRQLFIELAASLSLPYFIMHFQANDETLRSRVEHRQQQGQDASDATLEVLEHQLASHEPLNKTETEHTIDIDTEHHINIENIISRLVI